MAKARNRKRPADIPEEYLTMAEFSDQIGVTKMTASKHIQSGKIQSLIIKSGRYFFHPEKAKEEYESAVSYIGGRRGAGMAKGAIVDDETGMGLNQLRLRKLVLENKAKELDLQEKAGRLVNKIAVSEWIFKVGQLHRQRLQMIPGQIVDDVMAAKTRNKALIVIEDAINQTLQELSEIIQKGLTNE